MDLAVIALVFSAGTIAGAINGIVGGASLLTFPILVATGTPSVIAAASNTVGLSAGNAFALLPHRRTMADVFRTWRWGAVIAGIGAFIGGLLLIWLPERVFEFVVPFFVLYASVSMLRNAPPPVPDADGHPHTNARLLGAGVYSGYFGPGIGVIIMAVLAKDGRLDMRGVTVIKNYATMAANIAASSLFIATGHVDWTRSLPLMAGAACGGYVGGHASKWLSAATLRWLVVLTGLGSSVYLAARLAG